MGDATVTGQALAGADQAPPPLDLGHLGRQTMGDQALAREVLAMFAQQIRSLRDDFAAADDDERRRLAHMVKGSARGVGAFALADAAADIEAAPLDAASLARLSERADEVAGFIAAQLREAQAGPT